MAHSTLTSLYEFHDSLQQYHNRRRNAERNMLRKKLTLEQIWENLYGPLLLKMLKRPNLYHVICLGSHALAIMEAPWFKWTELSCECECDRLEKAHVHLIGECHVSRGVRQRFFAHVNERHGIVVKQRSSFAQRFMQLKDFQHKISAFMYLMREQPYYRKKELGMSCKHKNFLPLGLNHFSQASMKQGHMGYLWNELVYPFLEKNGYKTEVAAAQKKYEDHKAVHAIRRRSKHAPFNAAAHGYNAASNKREERIGHGTVSPRTEPIDDIEFIIDLIRDDPPVGMSLCSGRDASRIIQFLRQYPQKCVDGLQEFVIKYGPKEKDSLAMGGIQLREELSSSDDDFEPVDHGDD